MTYFSDKIRAKFYSRVDVKTKDECWNWNHSKSKDGYGLFWFCKEHNTQTAHRYSKEMELGYKIERKFDASHICHNRLCVNPNHILVETRLENIQRSPSENRGKCVYFNKEHKKWKAYCHIKRKQIHLGYFSTEKEALQAVENKRNG